MSEKKDELVIERIFDAPVELVWKAWSNPEMMRKWWGPEEFSCPLLEMDFRVGGKFLGCMHGKMPDGKELDIYSTGTYREIIPMKKIVSTDSFADKNGNIVSSEVYGMEGIPMEMELTVTFEDLGGKTKMVLRHKGLPEAHAKDANRGWNSSLDKLAEVLKK